MIGIRTGIGDFQQIVAVKLPLHADCAALLARMFQVVIGEGPALAGLRHTA